MVIRSIVNILLIYAIFGTFFWATVYLPVVRTLEPDEFNISDEDRKALPHLRKELEEIHEGKNNGFLMLMYLMFIICWPGLLMKQIELYNQWRRFK